ncbi:MAG: recombinase RecT [Candidatus Woesearchaeota archaeon]
MEKKEIAKTEKNTLIEMLSSEAIKSRINELLGKKTQSFIASIISLYKSKSELKDCEPNSILQSGLMSACLDLPVNDNLGFSYIVPYLSKNGKFAQFQMGYKGFIQLALRTGQYKVINADVVYEGELVSHDKIKGTIVIDANKKTSNKVIGYVAYFQLINGFEKMIYWDKEKVENHAKKFSKNYKSDFSVWKTDFDSMALKTVLKNLLSKYGILSVELQKAILSDQAIIKDTQSMDVDYIDNETEVTAFDKEKENDENKNNENIENELNKIKNIKHSNISEKTEKENNKLF